jgi:hypothetical protein
MWLISKSGKYKKNKTKRVGENPTRLFCLINFIIKFKLWER